MRLSLSLYLLSVAYAAELRAIRSRAEEDEEHEAYYGNTNFEDDDIEADLKSRLLSHMPISGKDLLEESCDEIYPNPSDKAWCYVKQRLYFCKTKARDEEREIEDGKDPWKEYPDNKGDRLKLECKYEYTWQADDGKTMYCPDFCLEASDYVEDAFLEIKPCSKSPLQTWWGDFGVLRPLWDTTGTLCVEDSVLRKCDTVLPGFDVPDKEGKFEIRHPDNKPKGHPTSVNRATEEIEDEEEELDKEKLEKTEEKKEKEEEKKENEEEKAQKKAEKQEKEEAKEALCFSQPHHPKYCEPVRFSVCEEARNSNTNNWEWF